MYSLKTRQVCLFFIAFIPALSVFFYPSIVAGISAEDCWLSALLSTILDGTTVVFLLFAIYRAQKYFPYKNYFDLLEEGLGKIGAKVVLSIYLVFFLLKSVIPIVEQQNYVELTLYETVPYFYVFIPFFVTSLYICMKKLRVIGRLAEFSFILTLFGIVFLVAISLSNADFSAILPIGANGIGDIGKGAYFSTNWFTNAVYLAFFTGEFKLKKKDGVKIFSSFVFSELIVVFSVVLFYSIFTYTAHRQQFALTEIAKFSTVINNVGRFDYIGICMLLFTNAVSLSLPLFFACKCLKKLIGFNDDLLPSIIINAILCLTVFLTEELTFGIKNFILNYAGGLFIFAGNILPVITAFPLKKGALLNEKS